MDERTALVKTLWEYWKAVAVVKLMLAAIEAEIAESTVGRELAEWKAELKGLAGLEAEAYKGLSEFALGHFRETGDAGAKDGPYQVTQGKELVMGEGLMEWLEENSSASIIITKSIGVEAVKGLVKDGLVPPELARFEVNPKVRVAKNLEPHAS